MLLDLLFPPKCPFCQSLLSGDERHICTRCRNTLPWCASPRTHVPGEAFGICISPLRYQAAVPDAVHRFKFEGHSNYAVTFGALIAQKLAALPDTSFDLITYAPISRRRRRTRGYDQGYLLAKHVGKYLNCPVVSLLQKSRHTPPQSSLPDAQARQENARDAYSLKPDVNCAGKHILLIDDVITSGNTLNECAGLLIQGGAKAVTCATLAQAR